MVKINSHCGRSNCVSKVHPEIFVIELIKISTMNEKTVRKNNKIDQKRNEETFINQLLVDQPNVGLGCRLTPDGNHSNDSEFWSNQCKKFLANQAQQH